MKKLVPGLLILITLQLKSQTVVSSCTASDSIKKKYMRDADRMALRRVFNINSPFKDSVQLEAPLRSTYQAALLAVYNATALPIHDTIVRMLNIHTKPDPELNTVLIKASPGNTWMQNLQNSTFPTGNQAIDHLIAKYDMQQLTYYQSSQYDVAVFKTDTSRNMVALSNSFAAISTVIGAEPGSSFNDSRDITDSINPAFTMLRYSCGWGSCENGCDYRSYWTFKVYPNCSVEYVGHTGNPMPAIQMVGIEEDAVFEKVLLYPNPVNESLFIRLPADQTATAELLNTLSQTLLQANLPSDTRQELNMSQLPSGIYYVRLKNTQGSRTFKVVKE